MSWSIVPVSTRYVLNDIMLHGDSFYSLLNKENPDAILRSDQKTTNSAAVTGTSTPSYASPQKAPGTCTGVPLVWRLKGSYSHLQYRGSKVRCNGYLARNTKTEY